MLADPLVIRSDMSTITYDATWDQSFPRIESGNGFSLYGTGPDDTQETWRWFVGHQFGKRNRYTARVTVSGLVPDLLIDNNNSRYSQSCYVVFDAPPVGAINPAAYASGINLPNVMLKSIGNLLVSVDTADPIFRRIMAGET
jgi:hypothetical protein